MSEKLCGECGLVILNEERVDVEEFKDLCYRCYKAKPKHICVDFDGVLAHYDGWKGPHHLGDPRPGALDFCRQLHEMGYKVCVFTTRNSMVINGWLTHWGFHPWIHQVTNLKQPALCYVDDRAVVFRGSFSDALTDIKGFTPYWKERGND